MHIGSSEIDVPFAVYLKTNCMTTDPLTEIRRNLHLGFDQLFRLHLVDNQKWSSQVSWFPSRQCIHTHQLTPLVGLLQTENTMSGRPESYAIMASVIGPAGM